MRLLQAPTESHTSLMGSLLAMQTFVHELSSFNHALPSCLLTSASKVDPALGDVHDADSTRHVPIFIADDRPIATTSRPHARTSLNNWVGEMQRGFLHGRSMLNNIVEFNFEALRASLTTLWVDCLIRLRFCPPHRLTRLHADRFSHVGVAFVTSTATQDLYRIHLQYVKMTSDESYLSFTATSGVRQGCL